MDNAKRFHIYSGMKKNELLKKALALAEVAAALREYIDAIPGFTADRFPAMPGIDRDYVDETIDT